MAAAVLHLLCPLLLLLPFSGDAQAYRNVSLGDYLSSSDENPKWVSPSGDFAFGFLPLPGNLFVLGVWFDKIKEKTLVWVANRENPVVQRGSTAELTSDGRLVLKGPQGHEIWSKDSFDRTVASAAMLDTGNFVLTSTDFDIKWGTFQEPTDTILPAQVLDQGEQLTSNLAETDYSMGRFDLRMQADGNLVFYRVSRPSLFSYHAYWASNTVGTSYRLVFNQSGYIDLQLPNGTSRALMPADWVPTPATNFYHRATLDYDGVFRQYVYPKNNRNNGSSSPQYWSQLGSIPDDACDVGDDEVDSGACGPNGYCILENNKAHCLCPPGFSYLDENYKFKGCKQDFSVQDCSSMAPTPFRWVDMDNMDWSSQDYETLRPVNEGDCRKACMEDCFCVVVIYLNGYCWKKRFPLTRGRKNQNIKGKALVKVALSNSSSSESEKGNRGRNDKGPLILIVSVLLSSSVFFNIILLLAIALLVLVPRYRKPPVLDPHSWRVDMNLRAFTYKELEEATNKFKDELGRGAFGTVYKGFLAHFQTWIAVKKLDKVVQDGEKEFETEVRSIGQTHHKNLVKLLGFCNEGSHRLLVYEFMHNGSLASFLFGSSRPSWNQRTQIAFGIARGLMYLHEECNTQIIHCDVKPQNILLDGSFIAKISDFGLAKLLMNEQTQTSTAIRGTKGYVAPEWFRNKPITMKVDVYSFGVMLLEIICCRKNVELALSNGESTILTDWAYDCFKVDRLDLLVKDEEAINNRRNVERMVMVALWCIQEVPSLRPSMKNVIHMLEESAEIALPPDPSPSIKSNI